MKFLCDITHLLPMVTLTWPVLVCLFVCFLTTRQKSGILFKRTTWPLQIKSQQPSISNV